MNTIGKSGIKVMGIVNLTDNSYFAESRVLDSSGRPDLTLMNERVRMMIEQGADIIDIGACSTRPGSDPVGEDVEWERLSPALQSIRKEFPEVVISIDTYWSSVVSKAYDLIGDFIVNDISSGEDDPKMLPVVGSLGLKYIAMHKRGCPKDMQSLTDYGPQKGDFSPVTDAVYDYFKDFEKKAAANGIEDWILDPGFGFAKTIEQNYDLLREMSVLEEFSRPILVGVSRKSMIYRLLGITPEESLPETQALHLAALERGADILRVHDVAQACRTVKIYNALNGEID